MGGPEYPNGTLAILGVQWGDEGKGKLVDIMCANANVCGRFNGGANAGHTMVVGNDSLACHILPCGILNAHTTNYVGNGVVLHLETLAKELDQVSEKLGCHSDERIRISSRAHLTFNYHKAADTAYESAAQGTSRAIGTTRRGIGPSYATKCLRISMTAASLTLPWDEFQQQYLQQYKFVEKAWNLEQFDTSAELKVLKTLKERFAPLVVAPEEFVEQCLSTPMTTQGPTTPLLERKWRLVLEGANGTMLDTDVGTYPYCTSSNTTAAGIGTGLGLSPRKVDCIIGVAKAYCTRVGEGPFPTEQHDSIGHFLREAGREYGATTKRPRRCGWFDAQQVRYADFFTSMDGIMITKLDVLSGLKEICICVGYEDEHGNRMHHLAMPSIELENVKPVYVSLPGWSEDLTGIFKKEDLPEATKVYLNTLERQIGVPIYFIGIGPDRKQIIPYNIPLTQVSAQ